jgi:hypothetical protein
LTAWRHSPKKQPFSPKTYSTGLNISAIQHFHQPYPVVASRNKSQNNMYRCNSSTRILNNLSTSSYLPQRRSPVHHRFHRTPIE